MLSVSMLAMVFSDPGRTTPPPAPPPAIESVAQAQEIPYNRKTCTVLGPLDLAGVAQATGAAFLRIADDAGIERVLDQAFAATAERRPVLVDVAIDYSKRTRFTEGIVRTNLGRLDLGTKTRFVGRALWRRVAG